MAEIPMFMEVVTGLRWDYTADGGLEIRTEPPASKRRTEFFGSALRRLANSDPADPEPTIMKSYDRSSGGVEGI